MSIPDAIRFWLDMIFRILPTAGLALLFDTLGLPLILVIFVAIFCCLGYRFIMGDKK